MALAPTQDSSVPQATNNAASLSTSSALESIRSPITSSRPTSSVPRPALSLPQLRGIRQGPKDPAPLRKANEHASFTKKYTTGSSPDLVEWLLQREAQRQESSQTSAAVTQAAPCGASTGHGYRLPSRPVRDLLWSPNSNKESLNFSVPRTIPGVGGRIDPDRGIKKLFPLLGPCKEEHPTPVDIRKLLLHPRYVRGVYRPNEDADGIPKEIAAKLSKSQMAYVVRIGGGFVILADGSLLLDGRCDISLIVY